ncbi:right-handed parallel beta-helix repeat-containing protein [Streptomyces poriferorum]|uniref:right-handed parallel beta-helix repeat-containing protein n=1 Tax=Streptomyces poriferorum TaxID=2798799 RepID=UPI00273D2B0C|nr:right-handed parallel beta-helix repeat-containing protein [Streptomyces sp. Alt1]WLQ52741.1 right-handed parallel beta-helix repeat-containing protein [Streptomyces sp. Alt1]
MRHLLRHGLAFVCSLMLVAGASSAATAAGGEGRRVHHVDCRSTDGPANGSPAHPWHTLGQVNSLSLGAGDRLLLARGSRCTGTLTPQGAGRPGHPLVIGAYGEGAKPVIDGAGAPDTVLLHNTEWVEVSGLEITNAGNPAHNKRGVHVLLDDYGTGTHYRLTDLDIHDVLGDDTKHTGGSAGILFSVTGSKVETRFDDVRVEGNTLRTVDREGIYFASSWNNRPAITDYDPTGPRWLAATRVVVRGNTLEDLGGDGIVMTATDGALVERNTVRGFQRRSAGYNAGIWPWNADHTVFQYNDVSGGETTRDGMAYDVDEGSFGTVFQYNYSHDNAGGFFLVCTAGGTLGDAVIRYNISQNDRFRGMETCSGSFDDVRFLNNTIYIAPGITQTVVNENTAQRHDIAFRNNVVVKEGAGTATFTLRSGGVNVSDNVLHNVTGAPVNPGGGTSDPLLTGRGTATGIADAGTAYELHVDSPALGAGAAIPDIGDRDFSGNPVLPGTTPSIGAYNGPGVEGARPTPVEAPPLPPLLSNGGFENELTGWATRNAASVAEAHEGTGAARLTAPADGFATAEQYVTGLRPATRYVLSAWIRNDGGSTALGAKGFGGVATSVLVSGIKWTLASVEFTTGPSGSTATVFCYREQPGTAVCDGMALRAL